MNVSDAIKAQQAVIKKTRFPGQYIILDFFKPSKFCFVNCRQI